MAVERDANEILEALAGYCQRIISPGPRERMMPAARFFFDAGSGTVLWVAAKDDQDHWGHAADLRRLPLSQALRAELDSLIRNTD